MKDFSFLLAVHRWKYGFQQSFDHSLGKYVSSKSMTLTCAWEGGFDSEFHINKQKFHGSVTLNVCIGPIHTLPQPLDIDFIGTRRAIDSVLGSVQHYPQIIDPDTEMQSGSFLAATLWVSENVFLEIFQHRNELKRFHLTALGSHVDRDWEGNPSWEYHTPQENCLYIIGYSYTVGVPRLDEEPRES